MDTLNQIFCISMTFGPAGLALTAAATTYSTSTAFNFANKGLVYAKSTIAATATPTTDGRTGAALAGIVAGQCTVLVWCVDASGTVKVLQGGIGKCDAAGNITDAPQFPVVPDTLTPFAYSTHRAASTVVGTWTPGGSNWNATGMTSTPHNIAALPDRPATV